MKKIYILSILWVFFTVSVNGQLTGITPNTGILGQTLQTTITGSGIFVQSSSPSGNLYQIQLIKGVDVITLFDYNQVWLYWNLVSVIDPNTVDAQLTIPLTAVPGVYDLQVITGDWWDPYSNQTTYNLPAAFTVAPPDGYITGNVYEDLNYNGIKDIGEPAISGRTVKLMPLGYTITTNATGDYSFPVTNGTYDIIILSSTNPYMFPTSDDTLTVTIASNNSPGNDFGLKNALLFITPPIGYQGISTTHLIVADEPIFHPSGPAYGNITQFYVYGNPSGGFNVSLSGVNVIDSFTVHALITVPANSPATTRNIAIYTNTGYVGYHYLYQQYTIAAPPSLISGNMFFDQNQNKINDVGEPGINGAKLDLIPDNFIAFSNANGDYLMPSLGGQQTLIPANNVPGLTLFTDSASYTFNAVGIITGKDFGFISSLPDYSILVKDQALTPRCNTSQKVYFTIRNTSNITYDAVAWVKFDPLMTFVNASQPGTVSNDTVYFNVSNLLPYSDTQVWAQFQLPAAGNVLDITTGATSLDINDVAQLTDELYEDWNVLCSWDPNDKQVTPEGILAQNFVLMTDTLEYYIRFQNTGNDTAFNVVVLDTLDSNLNFNTFELLGSSHLMQTQIQSNGAVKFTFNNILLVDSNANEPESHGYIRYRIQALFGLPDSTPVYNTAHIFFDFNPDVITNTTFNTLVYVLPVGLQEAGTGMDVSIYPNPFSHSATLQFDNPSGDLFNLTISDVAGKVVAPSQSTKGSRFIIEKNKLAGGVYFFRLVNSVTLRSYTGKLIIE